MAERGRSPGAPWRRRRGVPLGDHSVREVVSGVEFAEREPTSEVALAVSDVVRLQLDRPVVADGRVRQLAYEEDKIK